MFILFISGPKKLFQLEINFRWIDKMLVNFYHHKVILGTSFIFWEDNDTISLVLNTSV